MSKPPRDNVPTSPALQLIDAFDTWYAALEERHFARLTFSEVRRALQALSGLYVERRRRMRPGSPFDSAGKRAAFALFYGPLHFLQVRHLIRALGVCPGNYKRRGHGACAAADEQPAQIVDLGCGTGAAGAAWAVEMGGRSRIVGLDRNTWAVQEARWTYRVLGLKGQARREELDRARLRQKDSAIIAAFSINELAAETRSRMLCTLLSAARTGSVVLIIEPIAHRITPWWNEWADAFIKAGGRADDWRFAGDLPERLRLMDRSAGLDHTCLTCRSLWLRAASPRTSGGAGETRVECRMSSAEGVIQ